MGGKPCAEGGWIHRPGGPFVAPPPSSLTTKPRLTTTECAAMQRTFELEMRTRLDCVKDFGKKLGLDYRILIDVGLGYDVSRQLWVFPMRNARREIIGFRTRDEFTGAKKSIAGSQNGLFVPAGTLTEAALVVVEGPTDCAAACMIGLNAIGRPDCASKPSMVVELASFMQATAVAIIPDNDEQQQGLRGAKILASMLTDAGVPNDIVEIDRQHKDLRDMVRGPDGLMAATELLHHVTHATDILACSRKAASRRATEANSVELRTPA